jgi:hypothetical protein
VRLNRMISMLGFSFFETGSNNATHSRFALSSDLTCDRKALAVVRLVYRSISINDQDTINIKSYFQNMCLHLYSSKQ